MATNPFDPEAAKRQAQISQLGPRSGPAPVGWDATNWADPNMHSVKYDAGALLNGHTKPSEIGQIVQGEDFQKRFPGATFNGKDWLDFNGAMSDGDHGSPVHGIDVLMAADPEADTSNGIWWGAPDDNAAAAAAPSAPVSHAMNPAADNSALAKIMAELSATSKNEQSPAEREAILQSLAI